MLGMRVGSMCVDPDVIKDEYLPGMQGLSTYKIWHPERCSTV